MLCPARDQGGGVDVTSIDLNCDLGEIPALHARRDRRGAHEIDLIGERRVRRACRRRGIDGADAYAPRCATASRSARIRAIRTAPASVVTRSGLALRGRGVRSRADSSARGGGGAVRREARPREAPRRALPRREPGRRDRRRDRGRGGARGCRPRPRRARGIADALDLERARTPRRGRGVRRSALRARTAPSARARNRTR